MTSTDERRFIEASQLLREIAQSLDDLANRLAGQLGQVNQDQAYASPRNSIRP